MNILFGIQGTGNGHISRARVLAKYLKQHSINVTYLVSGRKKAKLFDMDSFGDFWHRQGLTFITQHGKVDYLKTVKENDILRFIHDVKTLPVEEFDLIITDFEPITAWAGRLKRKPVLGIGHQYAFGEHTPIAGESFLAKKIMQFFAPASNAIGLHWYPYNDNVLPPIIDTNICSTGTYEHVLVYLPFEDQASVCAVLNKISDVCFVQYAPELSDDRKGNVIQKVTSYESFKRDLTKASGVICNSGFELISECIHLGLPILTKPLNGQMEQHSNAFSLQQLKLALVINEISPDAISTWLAQHSLNKPTPIPDVAKHIAEYIAQGKWQECQQLSALLWQEATSSSCR